MLDGLSEDLVARRTAGFEPDLVGFSAMSAGDYQSIKSILMKLRAISPSAQRRIAVGGNSVSTEPELLVKNLPPGTVGIRFEGERPIAELLTALEKGRDVETVSSTVIVDDEGNTTINPPAPVIEELDVLPFAARDLASLLAQRRLPLNIQGSRGCCGSCSYCCAPGFPRSRAGSWRGRSPESLVEEMDAAVRDCGVRHFNFVDDDFLGPERPALRRVHDFAEALHARRLTIAFSIQARPASLCLETVKALADAGVCHVFLGIENDDPRFLREWGRPLDHRAAWRGVEILREHGVETQIGCILFHPQATFEGVRRFAVRLRRMRLLNYRTATSRLHVLPGSRMHEEAAHDRRTLEVNMGAFVPPIGDQRLEKLHRTLESILLPMRPSWVQAACRLPDWIASRRLASNREAVEAQKALDGLREVLEELDSVVGSVFFELLDNFRLDKQTAQRTAELRVTAFRAGERAARRLSELNAVESYDALREAILRDGGP